MNSILPEHDHIDVVPLEEGFSNKTYQISWQKQPKLVLRIADLNSQAFGIDRQAELDICRLAAAKKLTAPVLWHSEQAIVWAFLPGQTLPWDVQHDASTLAPLCEAIAELHQLPAVAQQYDVYQLIENWLEVLSSTKKTPQIEALLAQVSHFFQSLPRVPRPKQLMLCHNDLNPKNILLDGGKAWLIDWESAGMNDPLFDLALVAHVHHLTPEQIRQAYQVVLDEEPSGVALASIEHYRQAYVVRELAWLLLRHQLCGAQDLDCLQWYHALLNDPVFNPYFKTDDL